MSEQFRFVQASVSSGPQYFVCYITHFDIAQPGHCATRLDIAQYGEKASYSIKLGK